MSEQSEERPTEVHRLVDMVVEEVSLVDRAANKRRFLVVKRDDMADETTDEEQKGDEQQAAERKAEDTPLLTAVAALESLTAIVELLGSLGSEAADTRLAMLAGELRAAAEQLLAQEGGVAGSEAASEETGEEPPTSEEAKGASESQSGSAGRFDAQLSAAEKALSCVRRSLGKRQEPARPVIPPETAAQLGQLAESFGKLSAQLAAQQSRLDRVEKQFGLPNSKPPERPTRPRNSEVGWPLDLNQPMDRQSVDEAISFHDP